MGKECRASPLVQSVRCPSVGAIDHRWIDVNWFSIVHSSLKNTLDDFISVSSIHFRSSNWWGFDVSFSWIYYQRRLSFQLIYIAVQSSNHKVEAFCGNFEIVTQFQLLLPDWCFIFSFSLIFYFFLDAIYFMYFRQRMEQYGFTFTLQLCSWCCYCKGTYFMVEWLFFHSFRSKKSKTYCLPKIIRNK